MCVAGVGGTQPEVGLVAPPQLPLSPLSALRGDVPVPWTLREVNRLEAGVWSGVREKGVKGMGWQLLFPPGHTLMRGW